MKCVKILFICKKTQKKTAYAVSCQILQFSICCIFPRPHTVRRQLLSLNREMYFSQILFLTEGIADIHQIILQWRACDHITVFFDPVLQILIYFAHIPVWSDMDRTGCERPSKPAQFFTLKTVRLDHREAHLQVAHLVIKLAFITIMENPDIRPYRKKIILASQPLQFQTPV